MQLGQHTEAWILANEFLGKCRVFWSQIAAEIEAFQLHFVKTTYGERVGAGKEEVWTVVLTMVCLILSEISKVRVEVEIAYGPENRTETVVQYLWVTQHLHRVMDDFLQTQFHQHPEMDPQITVYLFKHRAPQVADLKQIV